MEIKLYQSVDTPCNYLEGLQSSSLIVDPDLPITQELTTAMSQMGYRRSGSMLYKPQCQNCNACLSSRIRINDFKPSKSQKRIINKAKHLNFQVRECAFNENDYLLYEKYIELRHADGDMHPPDKAQYEGFLCKNFGFNYFLETQLDGKTIAICQFDSLQDGLSAVYTFFDPDFESLSLGVLSVLQLISLAKKVGYPYVYLGYYIQDCSKMNYKSKYQPLEIFSKGCWKQFSPERD
ncbi:arginyltransferase [Litoribrevibacter euphylliae]|uniref:Aspartate/glutamate leucyltransferase n=1 Tax=Litoribrevibacter euphylliae TaxID=1834034 RepID=A0ABV7HCI7_9GAMM